MTVPAAASFGGAAVGLALAFAGMLWLGDLFVHVRAFLGLLGLAALAYGLAVARLVRHPPRGAAAVAGILGAALLFRLLVLPLPPTLSTDLYRYLWDGRLAVAGVSPYAAPPRAPELAVFRDATIYPRLNHPEWRTIYPPGAQGLFALMAWLAPGSVLAFKLLLLGFEVLTTLLLLACLRAADRPAAWVLVYAWHPLVVVELAGSGHLDAVALAATTAALWAAGRGRDGWAGACLGAGALVKLYPLVLLPAVWGRRPGRALAAAGVVLAAGYAVYLGEGWGVLGSLGRYAVEEEFNGGMRRLLEGVLVGLGPAGRVTARLVPLVALAAAAVVVGLRGRHVDPVRRALWLVGGYLVTVPDLFPWYALWIVPILALQPSWPWLYLTFAVALSYLVFAEPVWRIPAWVTAVEFGPLLLGLLLGMRRRARAPAVLLGAVGAPSEDLRGRVEAPS